MQIVDAMEELEEMERLGLLHDKIVLCVLDKTGDTRLVWDPNDERDVTEARKAFEEAKRQGKTIYRVGDDAHPAAVMHEFDAKAGKFIAVMRMKGG